MHTATEVCILCNFMRDLKSLPTWILYKSTHAGNEQIFPLETGFESCWITGANVMNNSHWCGKRLIHQGFFQDPNCNVKV